MLFEGFSFMRTICQRLRRFTIATRTHRKDVFGAVSYGRNLSLSMYCSSSQHNDLTYRSYHVHSSKPTFYSLQTNESSHCPWMPLCMTHCGLNQNKTSPRARLPLCKGHVVANRMKRTSVLVVLLCMTRRRQRKRH